MHCRICENKGQSTKCVSEEERKSRDGPPSAYAHVSERSIEQSHAFTHGFSPTAILKIGGKINAAISSQQRSLRSVVEKQTQTSRLPNRCLSSQDDDDMAAHLVAQLLFSRFWYIFFIIIIYICILPGAKIR